MSRSLELHPLCTLFPRMAGAEFAALVADVRENGLREPITLANGLILDGGNRYRACLEAGVAPRFIEFAGGNLVTFVLSANLHRRHMTPGQQAAIVASAQDWAKAQPASRPTKACNVAPLSRAEDRAAQSGASLRTQKTADAVARKSPELSARVARGEISLPKAARAIVEHQHRQQPTQPKQTKADPRDAEIERLRAELAESRDNARELAAMVEASDFAAQGEASAAKQIKRLLDEISTLKSQRDGYMTKCNALIKTVNHWKKKAGAK